jgi:hypothetical protein
MIARKLLGGTADHDHEGPAQAEAFARTRKMRSFLDQ